MHTRLLFGDSRPISSRRQSSKTALSLLLAALLMTVAGCGGRVLLVTRAKPLAPPAKTLEQCAAEKNRPCELPGIPFYAVGYQCLHTTVWLQPIYSVTLVVTSSDGKFIPPVTKFLGRMEFDDATIQALLVGIKSASQSPVDDYRPVTDAFQNVQGINPLDFDTKKISVPGSKEEKEVFLYSNSVAPDRYIDANSVFYYNVKKPWSGTANAEIDLNNEGILSKVSGQVEDKTLATILSALPISDLIKGAAFATSTVELAPTKPGAPAKYKLDLQIQSRIYKHTHSKVDATGTPPCSAAVNLVGADGKSDFNFTVEDATAPSTVPQTKPPASGEKATDSQPK